jgi:hypothetical protein
MKQAINPALKKLLIDRNAERILEFRTLGERTLGLRGANLLSCPV